MKKKKGILNQRNNLNKNEDKNNTNIKNVDDFFDLFTSSKPKEMKENTNYNANLYDK